MGTGALAFPAGVKGIMSETDAFENKKLCEAGAIMLAKSKMAEFAFDPMETVNSLLPGYTRNPYGIDRGTAGSRGATAAAVAANFGAVGRTDTKCASSLVRLPPSSPVRLFSMTEELKKHRHHSSSIRLPLRWIALW